MFSDGRPSKSVGTWIFRVRASRRKILSIRYAFRGARACLTWKHLRHPFRYVNRRRRPLVYSQAGAPHSPATPEPPENTKPACKSSLQAGLTHRLRALAFDQRPSVCFYGVACDRTCDNILIRGDLVHQILQCVLHDGAKSPGSGLLL